jgi:DinB superfamily
MRSVEDVSLREHLVELLQGGSAHTVFDDVIKRVPPKLYGAKAPGLPHSPWMLLEHMRIAQWDILEFSRKPKHRSPAWPGGYWPKGAAPAAPGAWAQSVKGFRADLKAMQKLVSNPKTDLYKKIPWGDGQTILREAMLVADHNAYHLGQLVDVMRALGAWNV